MNVVNELHCRIEFIISFKQMYSTQMVLYRFFFYFGWRNFDPVVHMDLMLLILNVNERWYTIAHTHFHIQAEIQVPHAWAI